MIIKVYKSVDGRLMRLRKDSLPLQLYSAWESRRHLLKGDPSTMQQASFGRFTVNFCPWRANRPQPAPRLNANIREPHQLCTFDKEAVIQQEGVAALEIDGRLYHVLINLNPVNDPSFILTKAPDRPADELCQIIHSPVDIADSMTMHQLFPPQLSFLFNSNPAGSTDAGATINHFHLQSFCFKDRPGDIRFQSASTRVLGEKEDVYAYLKILEENNNAYNLLFLRTVFGATQVAAIPRTLGIPTTPIQSQVLTETIGAPFYVGFLSISNQTIFQAMKRSPVEAELVLAQWQRETTVDKETLARFERQYRGSLKLGEIFTKQPG